MELLSDHMALDPNMNMSEEEMDEIELPIVETQPLQILIETSGSWDVNANCPETSTSAHGGSAKRFGFRQGEEFSCKVLIKTEFYVVYLNERLLTNSEHMVPVGSIHGLIIDGDSDIWNIAFGNPATLENFKIKDPQPLASPDSETQQSLSNTEEVVIMAKQRDKSDEINMDRIKAVKSTSNLYEPYPEKEGTSRELFALSESTRKSSYQLVFDLDEEEYGGKDRKDEDLRNEFKISMVNNAKSKSIQNLFHVRPLGKPTNGYQKAPQLNGRHIPESMEDDELWSIDFDMLANGLPKDYEVDNLFAFVDKRESGENGHDSGLGSKLTSAIAENSESTQSSSLRPLNNKCQSESNTSQLTEMSETQNEVSPATNQRKTSASGIPRLDVKYFQSLNQLDADACRKKLHNNTVKALRSGRRIVNGKGPKPLERSYSLPIRSKPGEHRPVESDNSRIPKPIGLQNCATNPAKSQLQKMTNGHLNGSTTTSSNNNNTSTAITNGSPTKPSRNTRNVQPRMSAKRSSIASLPPINNSSPKKDLSTSPKIRPNSKPPSPPKDILTKEIRINGASNVKPVPLNDDKNIDTSSDTKMSVQVDQISKTVEPTPESNLPVEIAKQPVPIASSPPSEHVTSDSSPKPSSTDLNPALPELKQNGISVSHVVETMPVNTPTQKQDDRLNEEEPEKAMIWGSVKPRETANNHFSNPLNNHHTDQNQLDKMKLTTSQTLNGNKESTKPNRMNGQEPKTNGSSQREIRTHDDDEFLEESASIQDYPSDSLKQHLTSSSTMNSSIYLYDLLSGPNISQTDTMERDQIGLPSDAMQKSTASLQPTTIKKDKSSKNFLQSPRKWLSRKLSMVKKSA